MSTETTYDADGNVTALHIKPNTVTISYQRKVPRDGGFGAGEEASMFAQIDVSAGDTDEELDNKIAAAFARCKGHVLSQLGVDFTVAANGVLVGEEQEAPKQAPKKSYPPKKGGSSAKPKAAPSGGDKDAAWSHLLESPNDFWDNRDKKASGQYKKNASDFKGKSDTPFADVSLWLDAAPEDVRLAYELGAEAE